MFASSLACPTHSLYRPVQLVYCTLCFVFVTTNDPDTQYQFLALPDPRHGSRGGVEERLVILLPKSRYAPITSFERVELCFPGVGLWNLLFVSMSTRAESGGQAIKQCAPEPLQARSEDLKGNSFVDLTSCSESVRSLDLLNYALHTTLCFPLICPQNPRS